MIKSIRLVNWRSHADTKLEFRKGTNLLVGIMGAGKSSILEGISFGLFGTFPAIERRKLKFENVVRLNEGQAKVVLEFGWEDSDYRVERVIERSKKGTNSQAELYKDGSMAEHGAVAVSSYIKNLTGVDYDLFTRAIYSEQNNIDYFLNLDPRKRKEEIDALLGLDKFELARSNIVTVIHRVRTKKDALSERFSKERLAETEAKEKVRLEELSKLEDGAKSVGEQLAKQNADSAALGSKYEELRKVKELYEKLVKEEIRLSAQLDPLQKELKDRKADPEEYATLEKRSQALSEDRSKLNMELRALDDRNNELSKALGSLEARMRSSSEAVLNLSKANIELQALLCGLSQAELSSSHKEAEQSVLSLESEKKSIERELSETISSLERLRPGMSECPLCFSSLTDDGIAHVKAEKEELLGRKRSRIAEISSSLPQAKKTSEEIMQRIRKSTVLCDKMAQLEKEGKGGEELKERRKELDLERVSLGEKRKVGQLRLDSVSAEAENLRMELANQKALMAKFNDFVSLSKRLSEVRSQLSTIDFDPKSFEELRLAAEKSRLESERLLSSKKSLEMQLKMTADMLKVLQEEAITLRSMEKDISALSSLEEQLSIYKNALLDTQIGLRLGLADAINTAMNEVWSLFYPYKNYHSLRLGVSEKDYLFEVDDGAGWKSLETVASGGERACAALALRVALAMVLTPKLSWLILDEPTHNLDSEAVELLSSALQFKVPEVVRQTFVITHDEAFMGSDFAASYKLSRDKDRNGETKVESS